MEIACTVTRLVAVEPPAAEADDRELVARITSGDERAFTDLVVRYQRKVAGLAQRLLGYGDGAEDIVQDVFVAALENAARFRGESSAWTWLAAITVNRVRSYQRRRWLTERVLGIVSTIKRQVEPASDYGSLRQESAARVRQAVGQLPSKYREVIVLRYLEELSIDEIAKIVGRKRNAVEVRLARARRLLEGMLQDESGGS